MRKKTILLITMVFVVVVIIIFNCHKNYAIEISNNNQNINKISIFTGRRTHALQRIEITDTQEIKDIIHWMNSLPIKKKIKINDRVMPKGPTFDIQFYNGDKRLFSYSFYNDYENQKSLVGPEYIYILKEGIYEDLKELYNSKEEIIPK